MPTFERYIYDGKSNRYNDKFCSTNGDIVVWPHAMQDIHRAVVNAPVDGWKEFLYLEKPYTSNRWWKIIFGVWDDRYLYTIGCDPSAVYRLHTDELHIEDYSTDMEVQTDYM